MKADVSWETIEPAPVQALAALFDNEIPTPIIGDELPSGWHWAALAQWPGATESGPDGHPLRTGPLAGIREPRRMFAGGTLSFPGTIRVGEQVRREFSLLSVVPKEGRQGNFTLATTETRIYSSHGSLAIVEQQNLIFRQAAEPMTAPPVPQCQTPHWPLLQRQEQGWDFSTDPTKLARFSAATSNGHRIHYDWPYATQIEGYPGLVVHGPLMTLSMLEVVRLEHSASIRQVQHRNLSPLFCNELAQINGARREGGLSLTLQRPRSESVNVSVEVEFNS
jgi:3-methylfumaryl-CoA hydratase